MWFLFRVFAVLACFIFAGQVFAFEVPNAVAVSTLRELLKDPLIVSSEGRDFEIVRAIGKRLGDHSNRPVDRFLVQGGLHGNEAATTEFVKWLSRRYARGESLLNQFPVGEVEIDFLPLANPDGGAAKDRYNARGVNLNRNFGILWGVSRENPGQSQFSEPETRAIKRLFEARGYLAAVDVHGFIEWIVSPSSAEDLRNLGSLREKDQTMREAHQKWYGHLRDELSMMPGYSLKTAASLGDGGAFEDWAFWQMGTLSFCLEMEGFQRYASMGHIGVMELTPNRDGASVDLFRRYELFIFRMFQHARSIRRLPAYVANGKEQSP
jgi:hypothetical protein